MTDWTLPPSDLLPAASLARAPLTATLGTTPDGKPLSLDLALLPHLAIAGASGSGKSTLIRLILSSLLMVSDPDDLQLVLVDVTDELEDLRGIPHLAAEPTDDPTEAADLFEALVDEMDRRYALLRAAEIRNITDYNAESGKRLPRILCVVDEFAELMLGEEKKRVETAVARLGIRGRKCGIHVLLSTQIPHATVLTARIKANMTGRIALAMSSAVHSRVALDQGGAEMLAGNGDAFLRDGLSVELQRFQTTFVSREELLRVVGFWRLQSPDVPPPSLLAPPVEYELDYPAPRRHRRVKKRWAILAAAAAFALPHLSTVGGFFTANTGCPAGTTQDDTSLIQTCDNPDGSSRCVQWAAGFTPVQRDANDVLTYVSEKIPDLGPWCSDASSPPGGE